MRETPLAMRAIVPVSVLIVAIIAVLRLTSDSQELQPSPGEDATPTLPPGADTAENRAIFVAGGVLDSSRPPGSDSVLVGPRTTYDEGFRGLAVPSFWIQQHEVTNQEYRAFDPSHEFPDGQERYPVVDVTWEEAMEYAAWAGGTLPTEAQWEFAASGPEGRKYPWGDVEPTCEHAYHGGCGPRGGVEVMGRPDGATPEGIHDLAGNVWEWVMPNWFEIGKTPVNTDVRRMRGGSFDDDPFYLRTSNRSNGFFAGFRYFSAGFRVVWGATRGRN